MEKISMFNNIVVGSITICIFYLFTEGKDYMRAAAKQRLGNFTVDKIMLAIKASASCFGMFSNDFLPFWSKVIFIIWATHFIDISISAHSWNEIHGIPNLKSKIINFYKQTLLIFKINQNEKRI